MPPAPGLAPRSDAHARTMMIDPPRADRPSQPMPMGASTLLANRGTPYPSGAATPASLRTLPGTGVPAAAAMLSSANSGARTPELDLASRGERPSAGAVQAHAGTVVQTKVEAGRRTGASNFLLTVLVLIAAGGAAAVVYFALPYLT
jgi:hypothetical protein